MVLQQGGIAASAHFGTEVTDTSRDQSLVSASDLTKPGMPNNFRNLSLPSSFESRNHGPKLLSKEAVSTYVLLGDFFFLSF